jgi:hypothetical protein
MIYYDIEVRNGCFYKYSCPDSSKLCKHIFLANRIFQVPFTERSRLNVTSVNDENAPLSNTIRNIQSTSNMDERSLRFSEFINEEEKRCQVINKLWKEKSALLAQQG